MNLQFIKKIPFFSHLSDDKAQVVMDAFQMKSFRAGDVIFQQGEEGDGLYGIILGQAQVERDKEVIATIGMSDFFGEMALVAGEPRSATVRALSDLSCFYLSKKAFDAVKDELGADIRQEILKRIADDYTH